MNTITFITDNAKNNNGDASNGFATGHFYVKLEGNNLPIVQSGQVPSGYYGKHSASGSSPFGEGVIHDDGTRFANAEVNDVGVVTSTKFLLDDNQYAAVTKYIQDQIDHPDKYNVVNANCVDFAQTIWQKMGNSGSFIDSATGSFLSMDIAKLNTGASGYALSKYVLPETVDKIATELGESVSQLLKPLRDDLDAAIQRLRQALTYGDPHLLTFDKMGMDLQKPGEFVLVRSRNASMPLHIQVRMESLRMLQAARDGQVLNSTDSTICLTGAPQISLNTAVAMALGAHNLSISMPHIVRGTARNDVLQAPAGGGLVMAGGDSGTSSFNSNNQVTFVSQNVDDLNLLSNPDLLGWYQRGADGFPATGQIIWPNIRVLQAGDAFSFAAGLSPDQFGFFMVQGAAAASANGNLQPGNNVTFGRFFNGFRNASIPFKADGTPLYGYYTISNLPSGYSLGVYSDIATNFRPTIMYDKIIGTQHNWARFDPSNQGNSTDYTNLVVNVATLANSSVTPGDTIFASNCSDIFGYAAGQDGVDKMMGFNSLH